MRTLPPRIPSGLDLQDVASFVEADKVVDRFLVVMRHLGIPVDSNSGLDRICQIVADFKYRYAAGCAPVGNAELRIPATEALGLLTILRKIVRLAGHPRFGRLRPHLYKLNGATVPQTMAARDEASNKIFELLIALVCLEVGDDVDVDHPDRSSRGANPDVIVTLDNRRWGLACKVICGRSPLTLYDRIAEGVRQVERSTASTGLVVLNLKNAVDPDITWPVVKANHASGPLESGAWLDRGASVLDYLYQISEARRQSLIESTGVEMIETLFANTKAIPAALVYLETATCVRYPEGRYRADFRVGDTLIEYLGLAGDPDYDKTMEKKRSVARRHGIHLLEIRPRELASMTSLEKKLAALGSFSAERAR